jgi:RsiW-degrading membrane proteinase PrsW (M82 family)
MGVFGRPPAFFLHNISIGEGKDLDALLMMAVLPAAVLLIYVYRLDPVEKEPGSLLLLLLFFGMLSTIPAIVLELLGSQLFFGGEDPQTFYELVFDNFIVVAVVEECCKFFFLKWRTWKDPNFDYVFDGIVYAVFVGLGFAIAENINYVFSYGPSTAVVRAFTAIPGHCVFAVYMGFFYGIARAAFARGKNFKGSCAIVSSIVVPVLCHGTYDTLASLEGDEAMLLFFVFLLFLVATGMGLAKRQAQRAERIY